jgi:hypothetical protein
MPLSATKWPYLSKVALTVDPITSRIVKDTSAFHRFDVQFCAYQQGRGSTLVVAGHGRTEVCIHRNDPEMDGGSSSFVYVLFTVSILLCIFSVVYLKFCKKSHSYDSVNHGGNGRGNSSGGGSGSGIGERLQEGAISVWMAVSDGFQRILDKMGISGGGDAVQTGYTMAGGGMDDNDDDF